MICVHKDLGFKVISQCDKCRIYQQGEVYRLSQLVPSGHCLELLHSLFPYLVTFTHGGWFKWERKKDRVSVCCPAVENNVCVQLKRIQDNEEIKFEYRVLKVKGTCRFYQPGMCLKISGNGFSGLCWDLFNNIFPYLRLRHHNIKIRCSGCSQSSQFTLFNVADI